MGWVVLVKSRVNYREYLINWDGISLISRGGNSLREHALMDLLAWLKAYTYGQESLQLNPTKESTV